jgi:hemolysin activation/secretion protein
MNQRIMPKFKTFPCTALALAFGAALPALAQQAPDAGQTLRELTPPPSAPRPSAEVKVESPAATATAPGGAQVTVQTVSIGGSQIFSEAQLLAVLGEVTGKSYDLAGLRALAARVSDYYHAQGYPFARAYLPPQPMTEGRLRIEVVEGRYGQVKAVGDEKLAARAQGFLSPLKSGAVIDSKTLERTTLILSDQPGIAAAPLIRPVQEVGMGDLDVRVSRTRAISGDVGVDNHGNRFTGENRLHANVQWDSPFLVGDQVVARGLYTEEDLWLGSLGYSLPVGSSGLRANVGYAFTEYQLAKDFANLDATGTAEVSSAGVSYPLIRSQSANLSVASTYQHKQLHDRQGSASTDNRKSSDSLPVAVQFDRRDNLGGGGVTYGSLTYTPGKLSLDDSLATSDTTSGQQTRGNFHKVNLDLARVQALPVGFTLFGRASSQWANKNLDSSEGFSLGGANGVRAYPTGEGNGDGGWFAQFELRYAIGDFSPYIFHDTGRAEINAKTDNLSPAVTTNKRTISGSGLGVRYQHGNWNADVSAAWRTDGGAALSDTRDRNPQIWVSTGYKF